MHLPLRANVMSTVRTHIGPADQGRRMSVEEFREAEEQPGYLYELARGMLVVTEVPGDPHAQIVDNIHEGFSIHRRVNPGLIRRIGRGSDVRLIVPELESDRHPDVAIVFRDSPRNARGRRMPELVVEVVSPGAKASRRDYEEKREEYLALAIREFWIVDRFQDQVLVLVRLSEGESATWSERVFRGQDRIESSLLPDLALTVADLWIDADDEESGDDA
jgi:Uma2 family endonuclease